MSQDLLQDTAQKLATQDTRKRVLTGKTMLNNICQKTPEIEDEIILTREQADLLTGALNRSEYQLRLLDYQIDRLYKLVNRMNELSSKV